MSDITPARKALVTRILEGDGRASHARRRAAFDNAGLPEPIRTLIDKVAKRAYTVTDADIAAVRASGLSEDQTFELVVCAAIGQATRLYDMAFAAVAAATEREPACASQSSIAAIVSG
jgi:hypothetical protein